MGLLSPSCIFYSSLGNFRASSSWWDSPFVSSCAHAEYLSPKLKSLNFISSKYRRRLVYGRNNKAEFYLLNTQTIIINSWDFRIIFLEILLVIIKNLWKNRRHKFPSPCSNFVVHRERDPSVPAARRASVSESCRRNYF